MQFNVISSCFDGFQVIRRGSRVTAWFLDASQMCEVQCSGRSFSPLCHLPSPSLFFTTLFSLCFLSFLFLLSFLTLPLPGTVVSVKKGDPHESVNVEWDVDGRSLFASPFFRFATKKLLLICSRHCRCDKPLGASARRQSSVQIRQHT